MATISNNTIVTLIDTQTNSGTIVLPKTTDIPYRAILFKDLYGTFDTKPLTLNTQSPDVFEDGTSVKKFNDKFSYLTLYADTSHSKWVVLSATQNNSITVSTLNGVQTGYISSLNVNSLTFGPGNGWLDLTALRAILVSTIQIDAGIGNFSSIAGDGSQIVALNAISSLSLQSTIVGLGAFGYLSTNIVPSTIVGLGAFGYISSTQLTSTVGGLGNIYLSTNIVPSTIVGLGAFGYLSTNIVPSTIVGLGAFGYISSTQLTSTVEGLGNIYLSTNIVPSTIVGLGAFGYLSTNIIPSTIVGLGAFGYISSTQLTSTVEGLGAFGYISSTQLTSTVTGLGNIYLSTNIVPSTIVGLGAFGYISTNIVPSTIIGLGAFGYLSSFNSISSLNISSGNLITNTFTTNSVSTVNISSGSNYTSVLFSGSYNGLILGGNINMNGSVFPTSGGAVKNLGGSNFRWNNFWVSTISSIHVETSTINVQNTITASTINVSTASGTNLSFFNISTNNITGFNLLGTTILSTQQIFCSSLQIGPTDAILDILGPLRTQDLSTITCQASTIVANTLTLNRLFGGSLVANGTTTQNLNPFSIAAQIGFGSNTGALGFYSEGHFRSTFTQVIQPTQDNDGFSNIIFMRGNVSSQNINTSTITGNGSGLFNLNAISSLSLQSTVVGLGAFGYLSTNIVPSTIVGLGAFGYLSTNIVPSTIVGLGAFGYISSTQLTSTVEGLGNIYLSTNIVPSTIVGLGAFGYLSTNIVPSTIVGLGAFGYLSTNIVPSTIVGLGAFGYLSTNIVPSTIVGLGAFGYISSTQLISTVEGLGNIYLSTFTGSTNFISSGQGFISSLTVNSLTFGPGNGWLDLTALRAILVSTIQIDAGIGNFSSISGNGSQIVDLNAISSLSLQSTVVGLGAFGYLSTNIVPSTIVGLGAFGYLSTNIVPSTVVGLGAFGYLSSFNSISSLNISTGNLFAGTVSTIRLSVSSINSDLIPSVDNTYDLGSAISRWRDLYVAGTSIHLGNTLVLSENANGKLSTNNGIITPSVQAVGDIILKGTNIKTDGILDLSNNEILNVKQTNTLNSGATNVMARRVYFDTPSAVIINNTAYTNVLTVPTSKLPVFNNSNNFYKYLNCTFSFRADGIDDTLAYYFDLSNETNKTMATGIIFDATYPFIENGNTYITSNRSITVQEQFDTSITSPSWADTDQFFPRMYVQTSTLTKSLTNMKFSMVYEPIFE